MGKKIHQSLVVTSYPFLPKTKVLRMAPSAGLMEIGQPFER